MNNNLTIKDELTDFLLYTTPNSDIKVEIYMHNETVWLPQKRMAELFNVDVSTINEHLKNIYKSSELDEKATIGKVPIVQTEGNREVTRKINFYNLDAILSVGYRVNSSQATQFRIWATKILREYIIKGFAMDDDRMKNGKYFGKDYFKELLERVRSIRTSESLSSSVNKFLEFNKYKILQNNGNISRNQAEQKAFDEYDEFNKTQKIESDFDKEMKKILKTL